MEVAVTRERLGNGGVAAPLEPRTRWGAAWAGTTTMLAVALLLWALAVAIVALAARPFASWHGGVLALWICAMVVTLVGALVGGTIAGYLSQSTRPGVGAIHGLLAWSVALLAATLVQFSVAKTVWMTVADWTVETGGVTMQTPGNTFEAPEGIPSRDAANLRPSASLIALSWSWFGTWFVAGLLAMAAGEAGSRSMHGGRRPTASLRPSTLGPDTRPAVVVPPPEPFPPAAPTR